VHRQRTARAIINTQHGYFRQSDKQLADASNVSDHRGSPGLLAW
jgi:hypothetical protein